MRVFRISLAAKYRLLFGCAVLLIIGAALAVPWYRMETLVDEQPRREAQRMAEDFFRLVLAEPSASRGTGVHTRDFSLLPDRSTELPRFVPVTPPAGEALPAALTEPFVADALRHFLKHPKRDSTFRVEPSSEGRRFQYAHAVRVGRRCLNCHDEGKTARPYREDELAGLIVVELPADLSNQGMFWNRASVIAAGALAGILAILLFYVITHRFILAPIEHLRGVTIRVAEGDLDVRASVQTGDEFEHLSDTLNQMLERLRDAQEELKRANRALDQKLGEMAETNVALYESNRVKSEFLANVSHELRTPLTSIIGFAELLREGPAAEAGGRTSRYAENILISGRILLEIINDLLDLAKIEAGRIELHLESVRAEELCATLVDFVRPIADKKRLTVELNAEPGLPELATDRGKLRQVLYNLLSNALKFTPEGGRVELHLQAAGEDQVELSVLDTGPGIAPEHQQIIFDKFRQVDQSATREHHGTGLGLAIAKELTEMLGGRIGLQSTLGEGSRFWVRLPVAAPQAAQQRPLISLV